jgi:YfiH family protein
MTSLVLPDWPVPPGVRALTTTRKGGASRSPWCGFNLGTHVGDDPAAVAANRARLRRELPADPVWLDQVHGIRCVDAAMSQAGTEADASFTRQRGVVCTVLTADCLPVLLCDDNASVVGIAHAGWRGLAAGVIEAAATALGEPGCRLRAWLGPAIGPQFFEVGNEVRDLLVGQDPGAASAFAAVVDGKWLCNIHGLARRRLNAIGIDRISVSGGCTMGDADNFFSYRRDGVTGRMASLIWLE